MPYGTHDRLKQAMAEKGLAAAPALALACRLSESTARSYLNGTRLPSRQECMRISPTLGVSGVWLFHGAGPQEATGETGEPSFVTSLPPPRSRPEGREARGWSERDAWWAQAERLAGKLIP